MQFSRVAYSVGALAFGLCGSLRAYGDGGWYVAPDYTFTAPDSDLFRGNSSSLGLSFGKRLSDGPDLELSYGAQELSFDKGLGTMKRKELLAGTRWQIVPEVPGLYLSLGAGAARLEHENSVYLAPTAYTGIGYALPIPGTSRFDLLNEARIRYTYDQDFPAGAKDAWDGQAVVKVRYSTPMAAKSTATTRTGANPGSGAPAAVGAPGTRTVSLRETCRAIPSNTPAYASYHCEALEDEDGDGVQDSKDLCRNTISGVAVDDDGCMMSKAGVRG